MDIKTAVRGLAAMAQATRLEVFRLLVRAGADGLPAGILARAVDVPQNTMSAHLSVLTHAGLISFNRLGRSIVYTLDVTAVRGLLSYLLDDCCQGRPDMCIPGARSSALALPKRKRAAPRRACTKAS